MNNTQAIGVSAVVTIPSNSVLQPDTSCATINHEESGDARLIRLCLEGDEPAWNEMLTRYRGLIYSIAARFGASRDDASDILQAVCLETLNNLPQLRNVSSFRSWLITVTVRQAWRWKHKYSDEIPLDITELDSQEFVVSSDMSRVVLENEQTKLLRKGVAQLTKRNAEMMRLLFFENPPVPYDEVARRLGLARGSIGFIRGRTLAKLRKFLIESGYSRKGMA
jgi:RNA polymerase sigma factor (sigma-70 family)